MVQVAEQIGEDWWDCGRDEPALEAFEVSCQETFDGQGP